MHQSYRRLLTELAESLGLDAPCLLLHQEVFIDGLRILLQQGGDAESPDLVLCSVLGRPPVPRLVELLPTLMHANHLWAGTGGGTLGLVPGSNSVTLCVRLSMRELEGPTLVALFTDFSQLGHAWMEFLTAEALDLGPSSTPDGPQHLFSQIH